MSPPLPSSKNGDDQRYRNETLAKGTGGCRTAEWFPAGYGSQFIRRKSDHPSCGWSGIISAACLLLFATPILARQAPAEVQQAVGCLLTLPANRASVQDLGLKMGEKAIARYFVGRVPGIGGLSNSWFVMIYSARQSDAWILIADRHRNGEFIPHAFESDRLHRNGSHWEVEEGFGGFHDYAAMAKFANWLETRRPEYTINLGATTCAPASRLK